MVAVAALALGTAAVALFAEASTAIARIDMRNELSMNNISPFKGIANRPNRYERSILNTLCARTGKITDSKRKYMAPELIEMLVASIFEDADPITFINENIVGKTLIFERALIANAIRLKLRILRGSTQCAGFDNEQLCTRMDITLKQLDGLCSEKCRLPFEEFYMESLETNPQGRYDLVLYLFSAYRENREAGVCRRFCDIIDTGLPRAENGYRDITRPLRTFLTYLNNAIAVYKIEKYDFTKILLEHLTSKADYGAVAMVDCLGSNEITKARMLEYITSGGHRGISLCFVVAFLSRNRMYFNKSCVWVKERLLDFFAEPHLASLRMDMPAEHFYYMLCTCFDDQGLRPILPELAWFVSEMVGRATAYRVTQLAESDTGRPGLLSEMRNYYAPLALGSFEVPHFE
ncbi:hypothetical protein PAPHI01_0442 [Pancytospora philotis]|nr:hypothetical protein PAPHI01_0442 [Pancytospora philotis]